MARPASAQQQAATTAEAHGDSLQEIVVTATKRESTVETTPMISITAITGQELQDRGITDLKSVVQSVPGVSMRTSGGGQTELEMRGMTSSGGNSSTVGFYLDDTPLTAPPPPPPPPPPPQEEVLQGLTFETNSAKLRPESASILDGVATRIERCHCSHVDIRGYTDSVGKPEYNQKLSERRANSVKDYLEAHGVAAGILSAQGFGEENPIASNATKEGRAANRRVTVRFSAPAPQ